MSTGVTNDVNVKVELVASKFISSLVYNLSEIESKSIPAMLLVPRETEAGTFRTKLCPASSCSSVREPLATKVPVE